MRRYREIRKLRLIAEGRSVAGPSAGRRQQGTYQGRTTHLR